MVLFGTAGVSPPTCPPPQGIEQDADGQFVVRIIMEFCDRGDLQAAIARGAPFSAARVLKEEEAAAAALAKQNEVAAQKKATEVSTHQQPMTMPLVVVGKSGI